jgi:predicted NUDIX family NTP pyrophosphohydrolase
MPTISAGLLLYRKSTKPEVLLVHPGGPFFIKKDLGAWSIPKGEIGEGEDPLQAAIREFKEETGVDITGQFTALSPIRQKGGKTVLAWAVEHDLDAGSIRSNTFRLQWPPRSGKTQVFPEINKAAWFDLGTAKQKINEKQAALLEELEQIVL